MTGSIHLYNNNKKKKREKEDEEKDVSTFFVLDIETKRTR